MKNYIDSAISRSRTTLSVFVAIMFTGFASYLAIPVELNPDVEVPIIISTIIHEGISPEDAERLLAKPAELELKTVDGVSEVSSFSSEGAATIITEFDIDFSSQNALTEVREAINRAKARFPQSTEEPIIQEVSAATMPVVQIAIGGDKDYDCFQIADEWQSISLNYTSGTTGDPKGVVFHHRGAYLAAISNVLCWDMASHPVYLWTLPMFHCNGWCFPWTLAAVTGTSVTLRHVRDKAIFDAMKKHKVTHFCGAPVVLNTLINAADELKQGVESNINVMTAGAAPPAAVIAGMENMGFNVTHVYGLTETYGPCVACAPQDDWADLSVDDRAELLSRQGVRTPLQDELMVADPETLQPVPKDGETMGEIFMRGNMVMRGYLKNPKTTRESFAGGWFHSGDLAVWHADGYIQIKDRSKDIIISGGENISSLEIESVLFKHPKILEAAVVASTDEKWGEVPCAFVCLKSGQELTADELVSYCRKELAGFKIPKKVVFGPIDKTSTGKVQKYLLREKAEQVEYAVNK